MSAKPTVSSDDPNKSSGGATETHRGDRSFAGSGRLEVRCPGCAQSMEMAVDALLTDLTCGSCGSHFSLVGRGDATRASTPLSKLGRFDLVERLGVGGFGTVWKARDKELDRTVAVKMPRQAGMEPADIEKFFREARAAAQLRHPNIVSVHEVGRDGDSVFIVSDFVRGVTLGDWLTGQRLTTREAAELCAKIADALHHAHEHGVIHRDLKPANVMIDGDGEPHLMDFGLARRDAGEVTLTMDGQVLGTPAYMSPEQAQGEGHQADRRSDVYSLGVVLFQLLTGELPFRGNARMLVHQVIHDEPPSPRKLNATVPKDLETITLKCLEKDSGRRYQSALEVGNELKRWLNSEPILARPAGILVRAEKWTRRNAAVAILGGAILGLLSIGTVALSVLNFRTQSALRNEEAAREIAEAERQNAVVAKRLAEDREHDIHRSLYVSRVNNSHAAADRGRLAEARSLLNLTVPAFGAADLRGFEWYHAWAKTAVRRDRFATRGGATYAVCASSDGMLLASSGQGAILIHDIQSKAVIRTLEGHANRVYETVFSPDGSRLASVGEEGAVKIWNPTTGELLHDFPVSTSPLFSVDISPNGKSVAAVGQDKDIWIWNVELNTQERLSTKHTKLIHSVRFMDDSRRIVTASFDGTIQVLDLSDIDNARIIKTPLDEAWIADVSADGRWIAVAGAAKAEGATEVASRHGIHIYSTEDLAYQKSLPGHSSDVLYITFSPDSTRLASGGRDRNVRLWDVESGQELRTIQGGSLVRAIAFSVEGNQVFVGYGQAELTAIRLDSGDASLATRAHETHVNDVNYSPDGKTIATSGADGYVNLWKAETLQNQLRINAHQGAVKAALFDSTGKHLLSVGSDGFINLWNAETGERIKSHKLSIGRLIALAYDPKHRLVAVVGDLDKAKVLNDALTEENFEIDLPVNDAMTIAFMPARRWLIAGGRDRRLRIWDVDDGELIKEITGLRQPVFACAAAPNGEFFVTSGDSYWAYGSPSDVIVWDAKTLNPRTYLTGHESIVSGIVVTPDSREVLTIANDTTLKVWDSEDGEARLTLAGHSAEAYGVACCPKFKSIASVGVDRRLCLWRAAPREEIEQDADFTITRAWITISAPMSQDSYIAALNAAREAYRTSKNPYARLCEAGALIRTGQAREAHAILSEIEEVLQDDAFIVALFRSLADVELGDLHAAKQALCRAAMKYDVAPSIKRKDLFAEVCKRVVDQDNADDAAMYLQTLARQVEEICQQEVDSSRVLNAIRNSEAIDEKKRGLAVELANQWAPDAKQLLNASWEVAARGEHNTEAYQQALRQARKANESEDSAFAKTVLAAALFRTGSNDEATSILLEASKTNAAGVEVKAYATCFLALCYASRGDDERAQQSLRDLHSLLTITSEPTFEVSLKGDGESADQQLVDLTRGVLEAVRHVPVAVAVKSSGGDVDAKVGILREKCRQSPAGVLEAVQSLSSVTPTSTAAPASLLFMGELNIVAGRPRDAVDLIRQAIKNGGSEHWYYKSLGWALHASGQKEEAHDAFVAALAKTPIDLADLDKLAAAFFLKRIDSERFTQLAKLKSPQGESFAHFYLGQWRLWQDEHEAAREHFVQAVQLFPQNQPVSIVANFAGACLESEPLKK